MDELVLDDPPPELVLDDPPPAKSGSTPLEEDVSYGFADVHTYIHTHTVCLV